MKPGMTPNMMLLKEQFHFDSIANRQTALQLARLPETAHVLDVGTGSGWMAFVLAQAGHAVTSVDIDAGTLMRAEARARQIGGEVAGRVRFMQADALDLPFADDVFDAVFSFDSMHHLPDCDRAISEMLRVCQIAGTIVIADLNARGLAAVRNVIAQGGERHEENRCRVNAVGRILADSPGHLVRHDGDFVTAFVLRTLAVQHADGIATKCPISLGVSEIPIEFCESVPDELWLGTEE